MLPAEQKTSESGHEEAANTSISLRDLHDDIFITVTWSKLMQLVEEVQLAMSKPACALI